MTQTRAQASTGMATRNTVTSSLLMEKAMKVALMSITGARTSMRMHIW